MHRGEGGPRTAETPQAVAKRGTNTHPPVPGHPPPGGTNQREAPPLTSTTITSSGQARIGEQRLSSAPRKRRAQQHPGLSRAGASPRLRPGQSSLQRPGVTHPDNGGRDKKQPPNYSCPSMDNSAQYANFAGYGPGSAAPRQ
ncbi:transient receptor potential cation channel subfamily M member 6 [Platysternon megacephalum]|uniref:Transient receptor potential cation channel subfamily M member 6 n=1 Tax=Platysternon megacephalum TaxID=55544 RepID=A0A4D9EY43_9SAUR|nr:transient receptor potential cation channel subfamily M member 6 [Platysternon megacephalum]